MENYPTFTEVLGSLNYSRRESDAKQVCSFTFIQILLHGFFNKHCPLVVSDVSTRETDLRIS
ncbi:MAG: hypothetical protein HOM87_10745 [Proteobacteria bacterium]|nr:hypothetical protein [Pseudomonadota bacterium]